MIAIILEISLISDCCTVVLSLPVGLDFLQKVDEILTAILLPGIIFTLPTKINLLLAICDF